MTTKMSGSLEFFVEEVNEEHAVSRMPIAAGMLNPFGTVHAGAILWLADVTATILALGGTEAPEGGKGFPLAINLYASLLGNRRSGEIKAEARFVHKGKALTVIRTEVRSEDERLLAEITTTHVPAK